MRSRSEQARLRKKYEDLSIDLEGQVDRLNAVCFATLQVSCIYKKDAKTLIPIISKGHAGFILPLETKLCIRTQQILRVHIAEQFISAFILLACTLVTD